MKKALTLVSFAAGNIILAVSAFAQGVTINVGANTTQGTVNGGALISLLTLAQVIVTRLVPIAIGLAVLSFFYFLIMFIWKGNEEGGKQKGYLAGMGYSILALFVMVAIWGIIAFLASVAGIGIGGSLPTPGLPCNPGLAPGTPGACS